MITNFPKSNFLAAFFILGLFVQCQDIPTPGEELVFISADRNELSRKAAGNCAFRYTIANSFSRLDNATQSNAIRAGFGLWQQTNPNVAFLGFASASRVDLLVRFVDAAVFQNQQTLAPVGLIRGPVDAVAGLRKESETTYAILLSNSYDWTPRSLTRAIAYHTGLYLGLSTSPENNSLMHPLLLGQSEQPSKADSLLVNQLYNLPCKDLNVSYLPFSMPINKEVTKTFKVEQQGVLTVKASGQIRVGEWVGISKPDGLLTGILGFSLEGYSLVGNFQHACLMYKINNEPDWHYCGFECTIETGDSPYVDITFAINDKDLSDNIGAYDVKIGY